MKTFCKLLLLPVFGLLTIGVSAAQTVADTVLTFRFRVGEDMFFLKANETELTRLYSLVDEYRDRIAAGEMPVRVDGYCASLPTAKENLHTAYVRAGRVKSELITQKGLKEADFITGNYATACNGSKDVVVVTLRIPMKTTIPVAKEEPRPEPRTDAADKRKADTETTRQVAVVPVPVTEEKNAEPTKGTVKETTKEPTAETATETTAEAVPAYAGTVQPSRFAVRTNILYDAMLLPTLGVEWRINSTFGVKLDGSLAWWGGSHGKVQKMWLLNPEVRWYLLRDRRLYAGVSGSYGAYNLYKYPLGSLCSKDTGYQGSLWSAWLTVGYQLFLSRSFSVDFNLGLGYTCSDYDSFGLTEGVRVYKDRDKTKNFFGPTQVGVNLIWTIGSNK